MTPATAMLSITKLSKYTRSVTRSEEARLGSLATWSARMMLVAAVH